VNIGKFKNFDNFKSKGNIKLEVIADDTYFTPWNSNYTLEQSKVVTVEMIDDKTSAKPLVEVTEVSYIDDTVKVSSDSNGEKIYKKLVSENIDLTKYPTLDVLLKKDIKAKRIVKSFITENQISGKALESTLKYLVEKF